MACLRADASAGNTGPLPPVYLPNAQQQQQQQQQQRLAAAIAARGSELQQQQLDLQQQQQQLSAALRAAQQQQHAHSQQALNSLAALHAATGGANSEPLPMLVSIPNAQGGMTLALAAPGGHHHAGDLQQLAGHHHHLLPGGLTLAQAGTAASLLQQQQRLAGALSTPPSPLPGAAGGATLVAMPGGGLGAALHGLHPHLGALGAAAGLSLGGLAAVQPLPASTAEMPGRFKVLPLAVQQRILTLCRTNPVITVSRRRCGVRDGAFFSLDWRAGSCSSKPVHTCAAWLCVADPRL